MKDKNNQILEIGQIVFWRSQAGGSEKQKEGTIIALLPINERLLDYLPKGKIPTSRIKAQNTSLIERVLVAVSRKTGIKDY